MLATVTTGITSDTATVITKVFDEAERRDPDHTRRTIGLVKGTTTKSTGSPPKKPHPN